MTRYLVTWPVDSFACATFGYPPLPAPAALDVFAAMAAAEALWIAECTDAADDPDHVPNTFTWQLMWSDRGKRDAIVLYVDGKRTDVRVEANPCVCHDITKPGQVEPHYVASLACPIHGTAPAGYVHNGGSHWTSS